MTPWKYINPQEELYSMDIHDVRTKSSSLTYCDSTHILKCSILWSVLKWDLRARNAMKAEKKRENVQSESIFPLLRISLCFQWWLKREVTLNINNYLCSVASWGIKEKSIYKLLMLFTAKIILQAVRVGFFFPQRLPSFRFITQLFIIYSVTVVRSTLRSLCTRLKNTKR